MKRVSESPTPKTDFELEVLQQLDKISETGNKFRDQIFELGKKLKSFQETEGQKSKKRRVATSTSQDWLKSMQTKLLEITNVQNEFSDDIHELEKRRFTLQELVAGKLEDVLRDVTKLTSLTETTRELKPKLEEGRKTTRELESRIEKMKRELKEKLDLLESATKSNQNALKSSLEKFAVPALPEPLNDEPEDWIVIQRRDSGPLADFERGWTEYENGFGSVDGNFWLGLKNIHELTVDGSMELRVELTDWKGSSAHANYSKFVVGSAAEFYRLAVGGYSGNAGDSLQYSEGSEFSTMDKKNGEGVEQLKGGWWKLGGNENLNGLYYEANEGRAKGSDFSGVYWWTWKNTDYSLQKVLMKIRQRK